METRILKSEQDYINNKKNPKAKNTTTHKEKIKNSSNKDYCLPGTVEIKIEDKSR